jgi:hypothetical protein
MKTISSLACIGWVLLTLLVPVQLRGSSTDWSISYLDQVLGSVPPSQTTARIGDMIIPVKTLRLWRDELAGAPAPESVFSGTTAM